MSVVSQVLKADDELRYPSTGELKSIKEFLETGEQRMRIAALAENEKRLFNKPVNSFGKNAQISSPGGNAYGERQRALCLRLVLALDHHGSLTKNRLKRLV